MLNQAVASHAEVLRDDALHGHLMRTCARICLVSTASSHVAEWGHLDATDEGPVFFLDAESGCCVSGLNTTTILYQRVLHALDLPVVAGKGITNSTTIVVSQSRHERLAGVRALEVLFQQNSREMPDGILDGLEQNLPRPPAWRSSAPFADDAGSRPGFSAGGEPCAGHASGRDGVMGAEPGSERPVDDGPGSGPRVPSGSGAVEPGTKERQP